MELLRAVSIQRGRNLENLLNNVVKRLIESDAIREERFKSRAAAAARTANATLGPKIRISVTRAGQFEAFAAAIADILRGSGLRYGDLAPSLAERVSPRELLEAGRYK